MSSSTPVQLNIIELALEMEKNNNKKEPWRKLDKTTKIAKLEEFTKKYITEHSMLVGDGEHLMFFFKECLLKSKLQNVKEIIYNKDSGEIVSIPALVHNRTTNHFTLKNNDYVSALKSLAPNKRRSATVRKPPSISGDASSSTIPP